MSLAQKVRLDLEDGRQVEVTYDGRDIRKWEEKTGHSALTESMSLGQLTWLGHHAAVRTGAVNGELKTYAAFDAVCVSVEGVRDVDGGEPPDPTEPELPIEASPKTAGAASSAP